MKKIYNIFSKAKQEKKKILAVLIDPDKMGDEKKLISFIINCEKAKINFFFVGGSLLTNGDLENCIKVIKKNSKIPVLIFPGSNKQISKAADGLLLLSLISGRNPELLIGQHVSASFQLKQLQIELLSTGYILIESGTITTALYVSGTSPIPRNKSEIAAATALAGEQLGNQLIYLDAGSGAEKCVPEELIKSVRNAIEIPIIVGGGIRSLAAAKKAWDAGADCVVIGTLFEKNPTAIKNFKNR